MRSESGKKLRRPVHARRLLPYKERSSEANVVRSDTVSLLAMDNSILLVQAADESGELIKIDRKSKPSHCQICRASVPCMNIMETGEEGD